ncbi:heme-degrading domain-containing protein [Paenibacillus harenae]|uniref:Uncharacterized protein (UPF0303 family) n=1 Tax=Paenibacillus harenae TaxID=306543 RepID=A0ABT9TZ11_PAEHA|nr:heme-degrading domain-containing protein [Paenibacillus harenae]MDQ0111434.1 uncharacterized protein (UPF0303 family) [Paenibacillus harenae]
MENKYELLLAQLLQQESDLQFSAFTNQTAVEIGSAILSKAQSENKLIAVDIRKNGQLLFHAKMDGTGAGHDRWIERKNNVVKHFGHSSYYMHVLYKSWNTNVKDSEYLDPMEYATEGGSFPILIKNTGAVGTIAVSGLEGHLDHEMITATLEKLLKS